MFRHVVARRDAVYDDVGRRCDAFAADTQHAHVALVCEQLGYDGAKGLVVTSYLYNDHDSSLSNDSTSLTLRRRSGRRTE
jgi:hypothetical protein